MQKLHYFGFQEYTAAAMRIIFEVILSQLQLSFRDSIAKKIQLYRNTYIEIRSPGHPLL